MGHRPLDQRLLLAVRTRAFRFQGNEARGQFPMRFSHIRGKGISHREPQPSARACYSPRPS